MNREAVEKVLGLAVTIEEPGFVCFTPPGFGVMYVEVDESEPSYLRLIYPKFCSAEAFGGDRAAMLERANLAARTTKVAKLLLFEEGNALYPAAIVEMFIAPAGSMPSAVVLRGVLQRCVAVVCLAAQQFLPRR